MTTELSSCYSCGHDTAAAGGPCPKCGRRLRTATQVRRLGWVQLVMGLFLVGLMGTVTFNLAPTLLGVRATTGGARFTGTSEQATLILGLFGLVITFGLTTTASGLWQIVTGRRNKWIFLLLLLLIGLLLLAVWYVRAALGR